MLAAARMVRSERAVRPCLPITLPRSLSATRNSRTVSPPSSTASTDTWLGSSTSTLAISSTRARMSPLSPVISGLSFCRWDVVWRRCLTRLGRGGRRRGLLQQLVHGFRRLRALREPVINALAVQVHGRRVGARVVRAHHLHRASIARALLVNHHHAIVGLFARTNARKTNH